jgi:hypothetical protein
VNCKDILPKTRRSLERLTGVDRVTGADAITDADQVAYPAGALPIVAALRSSSAWSVAARTETGE